MTTDAAPKPPTTVSALETISILMIAGNVIFGGIKFDSDLIGSLLSLGIVFWLVLKVTRRRSSRARIALTIMAALGFGIVVLALAYTGSWAQPSIELSRTRTVLILGAIIGFGLTLAQLILLWHPATTAWIRSRPSKSGVASV